MSKSFRYIIVAGINGAGKSTLFRGFPYLFEDTIRINADEILRGFGGDWKELKDTHKAMRKEVEMIKDAFNQRASFHIETTLSGNARGHIKRIEKAHKLGYKVTLHYVTLDNVETAIARVNHRVSIGGHGIPEEVIRKRYVRSLENLFQIKGLVDDYFLWDNSATGYELVDEEHKSNN